MILSNALSPRGKGLDLRLFIDSDHHVGNQKMHHSASRVDSVCYHTMREAMAMGECLIGGGHVSTRDDPSTDICTVPILSLVVKSMISIWYN